MLEKKAGRQLVPLKSVIFCIFAIFVFGLIAIRQKCDRNAFFFQKWGKNRESIVEQKLRMVFTGCCGYTLIGEKPVSTEYFGQEDFSNQEDRAVFFEKLQTIFKKSKKFILQEFHSDCFYSEIVLINVPLLKNLAINDRYFSKFVDKHYKNVEIFFTELSDSKIHIFETLKWDQIAIGIVLGFGRRNSKFYQRYVDLGFYLKRYPFICLLPFEPKPLPLALVPIRCLCTNVPFKTDVFKKNPKFGSFEDELKEMERMKDDGDYRNTEIPYLFQIPYFISKKGVKTDRWRRKYIRARGKLSKIFLNKKFQDVLQQLVSE